MRLSNEEKLGMLLEHLEQGVQFQEHANGYDYDLYNVKYIFEVYYTKRNELF